MRVPFVLSAVVVAVAAATTRGGDPSPPHARNLVERAPELRLAEVRRAESDPVQFDLSVEVAMPEMGWTLEVASVSAPDPTGRIVAKMRGRRPEGSLPQVVTWTPARIPLGALPVGQYLVDVLLETPMTPQGRAGVLSLRATD